MKHNASGITFSAVIVLLLLESIVEAQPPQHSKILSITMRFKNDVLLLENTEVVKGTLKTRRSAEDGNLYYEITSYNHIPVLSRLVRIPKQKLFNSMDSPGQLSAGMNVEKNVYFTIRVPYDEAMQHINFYSVKPRTDGTLAKTRSTEEAKGSFIAAFFLDVKVGWDQ